MAASLTRAETELSLLAGSYFETNSYYLDQGDRSDGILRVAPRMNHQSESSTFGLETSLGGSYNKHIQYVNLDFYDYDGVVTVPILKGRKWAGYVSADYKRVSDPAGSYLKVRTAESATEKIQERINRDVLGGRMGTDYKWTSLSTIKLDSRYQMETYEERYHQYMDNFYVEGSAYYDYQFLPETTFFFGGMMGTQVYQNGTKNCPNTATCARINEIKYSSQYIEGRSGIRGRLAERTRVDASAAIQLREYEKESGFSEPVFNLRIEEQFTPKDLLIAGHDYEIHDSKWTNYVIDQTTYIGYARILGDQLLLLGKMAYTYSSYSKPLKREDQRLAGSFRVDYSISPTAKLSGVFDLDILNSDAINRLDGINFQPDKPASYENFRTGIELIQYF